MYNRYIPPTKATQVPREDLRERATAPQPPPPRDDPVPVLQSSTSLYSRYTPGYKPQSDAQPTRIVFGDDDIPEPAASARPETIEEDVPTAIEEKKPKKSKSKKSKDVKEDGEDAEVKESKPRKRKRGESEKVELVEDGVPEEKDVIPEPVPEPPAVEEERKPKREKKKKRKQEEDADAVVDGDTDQIRKRHKSVFEKVQKALQAKDRADLDREKEDEEAEPEVEHGLEPLPQPEPVVFDESKLTYETLPPWLASPVKVDPDTRQPFTELGISAESAKVLESKGFSDAFAVQTAVLPLLLPSPDRQGDVVVAAPTGSGKTLSYVLPMVHDISKGRVTRLRALIVLPTRDLVHQVQLACEACAAAFSVNGGKRIKIGTAMGNKVFKEEQSAIMGEEQQYDPQGYKQYLANQNRFVSLEDSDEEDEGLELEGTQPLPYHVVAHISKVDILICTPGRLVEHITKTPGFTLDYVRWLIVDEADKLLAQDFQQWLDTVTDKLGAGKPGARDFPGSNKSGVRKVILSATMTRDLSLLNGLRLSRPKLLVVEGTRAGEQSLPPLLKEYAIKIREPSLKPLYLVDLLTSKHMAPVNGDAVLDDVSMGSEPSDSESSNSESDSDSSSSSSSDSESDSESETHRKLKSKPTTTTTTTTTTPALPTTLRILVASDLVSRGIDLLNLEHVVNYDLPISETSLDNSPQHPSANFPQPHAHHGAPPTLLLTLLTSFLLLATSALAASAVVGIDLGTEYIKAALVKPGIPLEIVLTKDSRRKEISAVTFKPSSHGAKKGNS
ncbi:ATP-dependent RNA helicase dbp6 [Collariella sp. IMI 366227]|nr:ATP-dependent RNA helicase dbp6 [Collariella sp. IMI 366227]